MAKGKNSLRQRDKKMLEDVHEIQKKANRWKANKQGR
jgi:hypothetical protein